MPGPLRLGIVGFGWAGRRQAQAIRSLHGRVTVVAVVEPSAPAREAARVEWNIPAAYGTLSDLFAKCPVDAVSVCTPHALHTDPVLASLEARVPVLVEKPLASSLAEADRMIDAAERAGVPLMVAETVRFRSVFQEASRIVTGGQIGPPVMVRVDRLHHMHEYLRARPWFLSDRAGGIMASGGIHDFELVRMLGGEVSSVYALAAPKALDGMAGDDTSVAIARLAGGGVAVVTESFSAHSPAPHVRGMVTGVTGTLWFDQDGGLSLLRGGQSEPEPHPVQANDPFVDEIAHFAECVSSGARPVTDARDQRRPLAAVAAAYASMRLGRPVSISETDTPDLGRLDPRET